MRLLLIALDTTHAIDASDVGLHIKGIRASTRAAIDALPLVADAELVLGSVRELQASIEKQRAIDAENQSNRTGPSQD